MQALQTGEAEGRLATPPPSRASLLGSVMMMNPMYTHTTHTRTFLSPAKAALHPSITMQRAYAAVVGRRVPLHRVQSTSKANLEAVVARNVPICGCAPRSWRLSTRLARSHASCIIVRYSIIHCCLDTLVRIILLEELHVDGRSGTAIYLCIQLYHQRGRSIGRRPRDVIYRRDTTRIQPPLVATGIPSGQ